jgi:hypothetical protein
VLACIVPPNLLLVPAPDSATLTRLADRYQATGEGEAALAAEFQRFLRVAEVLTQYVVALTGKPSME